MEKREVVIDASSNFTLKEIADSLIDDCGQKGFGGDKFAVFTKVRVVLLVGKSYGNKAEKKIDRLEKEIENLNNALHTANDRLYDYEHTIRNLKMRKV